MACRGQTHRAARMANHTTIYRKSKILPVHSVNRAEGQCQEAQAGIKPRDVLISVAGKEVKNVREMLNAIAQLPPEKPSKFVFLRDEKEIEFEVVVGTRPKPAGLRRNAPPE